MFSHMFLLFQLLLLVFLQNCYLLTSLRISWLHGNLISCPVSCTLGTPSQYIVHVPSRVLTGYQCSNTLDQRHTLLVTGTNRSFPFSARLGVEWSRTNVPGQWPGRRVGAELWNFFLFTYVLRQKSHGVDSFMPVITNRWQWVHHGCIVEHPQWLQWRIGVRFTGDGGNGRRPWDLVRNQAYGRDIHSNFKWLLRCCVRRPQHAPRWDCTLLAGQQNVQG